MGPTSTLSFALFKNSLTIRFVLLLLCIAVSITHASAVTRISINSGNISNPTTWLPTGVPVAGDILIIKNNHIITVNIDITIQSVTIDASGSLKWLANKKLTINSGFIVNGTAEIIDGNIELLQNNGFFKIGDTGTVIWQPLDNTSNGATLFTKGKEEFHPTSTLVINKWYNYNSVPLGSVVSGNFGNLSVTTLSNGLLFEWNQNNEFETHQILGKFTIDQGWIVLDKSGAISNTFIEEIYLKNVNSYLDIHSGTHSGSFKIITNSLTNIGGTMNGIYNGDGNIELVVDGDVLNLGNIELIYNSGVQGISNGDSKIRVSGHYKQTHGDFRGIFNLSSNSAGIVDMEFGSMELTGGIFMAHYACHTNNNTSKIVVNNDVTIDYINSSSKFRGNGLNSLSGTKSNNKLDFEIKGNLIVKGNPIAEFTTSGSTGIENVKIKGLVDFIGCTVNFNYGDHQSTLEFEEVVTVKGSEVNFSKTEGTLVATFESDLNIESGIINIKSAKGSGNVHVEGNYSQSGGTLSLHNNTTTGTSNAVYMTVNGDFTNISGTFTFDKNNSSTIAHMLSISGEKFTVGGQAVINSVVSAVNPIYGIIYYDRTGLTSYYENSSSAKIQNLKQVVSSGCTLKIAAGNMQSASSNILVTDMIKITSGGTIDAGTRQIYSNSVGLYSGITVLNGGKITTTHSEGLYNGTANATIKANGNMNYILQPLSTIEYNSSGNQIVSGTGVGTAQSTDQQYGILRINKPSGVGKLNASGVVVRKALDLIKGELQLNGYNITILSGVTDAITANEGFIKSETNASNQHGLVIWKNIEQGTHTIPFGTTTDKKLPLSFEPISGLGLDFSASTRSSAKDNRPLPSGISNINLNNNDVSNERVIDRWFHINATGINANITLTYLPSENTTTQSVANSNFSAMAWKNAQWNIIGGNGVGNTLQTGTVIVKNNSSWGNLLLVSNETPEPADILTFEAILKSTQVDIKWISIPNAIVTNYTIEISTNGFNFTELITVDAKAASSSSITYSEKDLSPKKGTSYYRLRQNNADGDYKYSNNVKIENPESKASSFELISVGPNPFSTGFTIKWELADEAIIDIKLTSTNGQVAIKQIVNSIPGVNTHLINDVEDIVSGIYILTITDGKTIKNLKLFKN